MNQREFFTSLKLKQCITKRKHVWSCVEVFLLYEMDSEMFLLNSDHQARNSMSLTAKEQRLSSDLFIDITMQNHRKTLTMQRFPKANIHPCRFRYICKVCNDMSMLTTEACGAFVKTAAMWAEMTGGAPRCRKASEKRWWGSEGQRIM